MLLPVLTSAKNSARKAQCASNLKQWGVAVNMYAGDFQNNFPLNTVTSGATDPSWMNPNFSTFFYPQYLFKDYQGTAATGERNKNDVFYCPTDNWHRAHEVDVTAKSDRL